MAKKWYFNPEGQPALFRLGNYIYRAEDNKCLYWEQGGSWHEVEGGGVAYYIRGDRVYAPDGRATFSRTPNPPPVDLGLKAKGKR